MELLPDAIDYGDAPSFVASKVCRMFFVTRHILRITFARKDIGPDGRERYLVTGHVDYDIDDIPSMRAQISEGLALVTAVTQPSYTRSGAAAH